MTLFKLLRTMHGLSLNDIAVKVQLPTQRISLIELDRASATLDQRRALASLFDVPADKILSRIDDQTLADVTAFAVGRAS